MRVIQLSPVNHSQNPLSEEQGRRKRRNQSTRLKFYSQGVTPPKRHRPDLCMDVFTTLGGGSPPDNHPTSEDAPSNKGEDRSFHSNNSSKQRLTSASGLKESLLLEGATESVSSHAEDDLTQASSQHNPHQSVRGETDVLPSNNARTSCPRTRLNTSDAELDDLPSPSRECFTNEQQALAHRRARTSDTPTRKPSPTSLSFRNLQASEQNSLQSRDTKQLTKSSKPNTATTVLRNRNLPDQLSNPVHRDATKHRKKALKDEQAKRFLRTVSGSYASDHLNTSFTKEGHNRIEAVQDQETLQRQIHPNSLQSQHDSNDPRGILFRDTSSRTPQGGRWSPENRASTATSPTSARSDGNQTKVDEQSSEGINRSEEMSNGLGKDRQRRVLINKSAFIATGVRVRIQPRKSSKAQRRRSRRHGIGNGNMAEQSLNQVGGGNFLNGAAMSVAEHNRITVAEETPSNTATNSARKRSPIVERGSSLLARRRSRHLAQQRRLSQQYSSVEVIQINDSDEEQSKAIPPEGIGTDEQRCDLASAALAKISIRDEGQSLKDLGPCPYLKPLTEEEEELVSTLFRRKDDEEIRAIPSANIVLRGADFKRLRGERWLNDEIINAYASLVNVRNDAILKGLAAKDREDIPNTYMFNTYFYTRLSSGPESYDYEGVRRWTTKARIDVTTKDLLLFPINLGNHHWVLAGIDTKEGKFFYLDSMAGRDKAGVLRALKRWLHDELKDKHKDTIPERFNPERWSTLYNRYIIRRVGVLPSQLEPQGAAKNRLSEVPKQRDGGSCGVFATKMADCLSLGIKVYFNQKDIKLIRHRMALDLLRGQLHT